MRIHSWVVRPLSLPDIVPRILVPCIYRVWHAITDPPDLALILYPARCVLMIRIDILSITHRQTGKKKPGGICCGSPMTQPFEEIIITSCTGSWYLYTPVNARAWSELRRNLRANSPTSNYHWLPWELNQWLPAHRIRILFTKLPKSVHYNNKSASSLLRDKSFKIKLICGKGVFRQSSRLHIYKNIPQTHHYPRCPPV